MHLSALVVWQFTCFFCLVGVDKRIGTTFTHTSATVRTIAKDLIKKYTLQFSFAFTVDVFSHDLKPGLTRPSATKVVEGAASYALFMLVWELTVKYEKSCVIWNM